MASLPSIASPVRTLEGFESGKKHIRVETFGDAASNAPSIIVLHGATGIEFANRFIATIAQDFASRGFVVHLVHYFDRTGSRYADDATIHRSSKDWLAVIDGAVEFVHRSRPSARIGLFGYSLGGYLAAAESVRNDHVAAAVILAGGIDEDSKRVAKRAAPTLIFHGGADSRVHPEEARELARVLRKAGGSAEVRIYPGEGHILQMPTFADVVRRSAIFFQSHLTHQRK